MRASGGGVAHHIRRNVQPAAYLNRGFQRVGSCGQLTPPSPLPLPPAPRRPTPSVPDTETVIKPSRLCEAARSDTGPRRRRARAAGRTASSTRFCGGGGSPACGVGGGGSPSAQCWSTLAKELSPGLGCRGGCTCGRDVTQEGPAPRESP